MKIDFLGLQDIKLKGYEASLTYLDGREVKYEFENDEEREDFVYTVESYVKALGDIFTFNPN